VPIGGSPETNGYKIMDDTYLYDSKMSMPKKLDNFGTYEQIKAES